MSIQSNQQKIQHMTHQDNPNEQGSDDILRVCLMQPPLRQDQETPLEATERVIELIQQAARANQDANQKDSQQKEEEYGCSSSNKRLKTDQGSVKTGSNSNSNSNNIDLFVLPELCPIGYTEDTFAKHLPKTSQQKHTIQQCEQRLHAVAQLLQTHICYGTIGWKTTTATTLDTEEKKDNNEPPPNQPQEDYFIRQVVVNPNGQQIAKYDKMHLCDYGDCAETRFFTPGHDAVSFCIQKTNTNTTTTTPSSSSSSWNIGLLVCADMRVPQLAQRLTQAPHKADVILQPACFARDCSFRTWASFCETRAVETGCYWLATNYAGDNFGQASATPPWVDEEHEPTLLQRQVGWLTTHVSRRTLDDARRNFPFHRRAMEMPSTVNGQGLNDTRIDFSRTATTLETRSLFLPPPTTSTQTTMPDKNDNNTTDTRAMEQQEQQQPHALQQPQPTQRMLQQVK